MKKVLIIPSWYPTYSSPYLGIFFKIQTELMLSGYDMKVLAGKEVLYGRKKFLKYLTSPQIHKIQNYFIQTDYLESFEYKQAAFKSIKNQLNEAAKAYWLATKTYFINNNWKPDLVHAHDVFWGGYYANYIAKKLGTPSIITHHNPLIFNNFSNIKKELFKQTIENTNELLCVSNFDKRTLLISGYDCNPHFVGNFIDEEKFKLKSDFQAEDDIFKIFSVGIASKRKDFPTLLKAINYLVYDLNQKNILLTLNISDKIADGVSLDDIKKMAIDLKIDSYCRFVKDLSLQELVNHYQNANVFVSSSYFETFGVAVCEAMCCGTPVIAVNNGGIDDIINYKNGIRISIGDHINMALAISDLKNKNLTFSAETVRDSIVTKYGRLEFFKRISDIYDRF